MLYRIALFLLVGWFHQLYLLDNAPGVEWPGGAGGGLGGLGGGRVHESVALLGARLNAGTGSLLSSSFPHSPACWTLKHYVL